jgi:RNA polymerase sigma factor (sigma-70 family)
MNTAEDVFLEYSGAIRRITQFICRRCRLDPAEAEDFASFVNVKLIENNYEIIRKFEGRAAFGTYLTTVIQHLSYQYRVGMWGKWRPSAEARRMGETAMMLERLISRDGYTYGEAVQLLTTGNEGEYTAAQLNAIWLRLPIRVPRPVLVSQAAPPDSPVETDADDRLMSTDRQEVARAAARALDEAIEDISPDERLILQLRFWESLKVPQIAEALGMPPKKVYKRIEKLLAKLRVKLERANVSQRAINDLLAHDGPEIKLEQLHPKEGKSPARPSDRIDGVGGGVSRFSR